MEKQKFSLEAAMIIMGKMVNALAPFCERIETAGSVRRLKKEVGDLELVCVPTPYLDMLGNPTEEHALDYLDWNQYGRVIKSGHKYKQIELYEGINLDLFMVTPPAQFGVIFLIRTGPADYSHRFVTSKQSGGMLPSNLKVKDRAIWKGQQLIETPEEQDVYNLIGQPWIPPYERI